MSVMSVMTVTQDVLVIEVLAGMGNRLRAMISAMCWAEDRGMSLHVIWSANDPACTSKFGSLFEPSSLPRWVTVDMGPLEGDADMILSPDDMEMHPNATQIRSYGHFYQKDPVRWLAHLRALRPVASLIPTHPFLHKSQAIAIGVHIRRGDHNKAIKSSPTSAFMKEMDAMDADTVFVVATDSQVERVRLTERYGERVWFPATSLSRMTQRGMCDAVRDFIALSRCKMILGSYNSSFSEMAALYGDVPMKVVLQS
jgi:hypothetical protein